MIIFVRIAILFTFCLFFSPPPPTLSVEDFQRDEAIDCKVVELIRCDILPHAKSVPSDFVIKVMNILNKGSIHSATSAAFIGEY